MCTLNCPSCGYSKDRVSLRFRRLYALDRGILLGAAPAGDQHGAPVVPRTGRNSDRVMARRSVAKLIRYGLLDRRWYHLKSASDAKRRTGARRAKLVGRARWCQMVRRTPLGDELVIRYGREIETPGRPIRWDERLADAQVAAIARCTHGQERPNRPT